MVITKDIKVDVARGTTTVQFLGFLCVYIASSQGDTEQPLPCNYNILEFVCALSRGEMNVPL